MKALILSTLVLAISAQAEEAQRAPVACGERGSWEQRVADCKTRNGALASKEVAVEGGARVAWNLAFRGESSDVATVNEIWIDSENGLVWGPRLDGSFEYSEALRACRAGWRLPTSNEFRSSEDHGMRQVLKNLSGKIYWTATPSDYPTAAFYYDGSDGFTEDGNRDVAHSVRCVRDVR